MWYQTFTVKQGTGTFPIDMLRYDCCFPADQDATGNLVHALERGVSDGVNPIRLGRWARSKTDLPTFDRWASFCWSVDRQSVKFHEKS